MSETTGWRNGRGACDYMKDIGGERYEIHKGRDDMWHVWLYSSNLGSRYYLADAKRAAHRHAEGKA